MRGATEPAHAFVGELEETVAAWAQGRVTCTVVLPIDRLAAFNDSVGLPPTLQERGRPGVGCRLVLLPIYGPTDPESEGETAIAAAADALLHLLELGIEPQALRRPITERLAHLARILDACGIEAAPRRRTGGV